MYFTGQPQIINQLKLILPEVFTSHIGINFLLRGKSGYGKTKLAFSMAQYLAGPNFGYCMGDRLVVDRRYWVHIIDEVHLLADPEELYPLLDGGEFVFILCTNDQSPLKEPLINRCTDLHFVEYEHADLVTIVKNLIPVTDEQAEIVIKASGGNPRLITKLCQRLILILRAKKDTLENLEAVLTDVIGVVDGLDVAAREYMRVLNELGGRGSLSTISAMLHLDEATLRAQVEPVLLWNKKIKITSRGREAI